MSDEPNPPSLRLRPRQSPASAVPAAPIPAPEPAVPVTPLPMTVPEAPIDEPVAQTGGESDLLRLRLKPKSPPPEAPTITFSTPVPFSSPPIAVPENTSPAPAADPLPPPVERPVAAPPLSQGFPPPVAPPKPLYVPTPRNLTEPVAMPQEPSAPPTIKADKLLAGIVLVVLLVVGAFYGISYLHKSRSKTSVAKNVPPPAAAPTAKPPPPPAGSPKLVEKPTSAAGKAIATARDAVAANDARQNAEGVASVLEGSSVPVPARTSHSAEQASSAEPAAPAAPAEPPPPPPATEPFKQFVVNMRVNGVFQGENARAMLNGKMAHPGDVVNAKLAITLFKIDVDAKQLIFRDDTGATVIRRF